MLYQEIKQGPIPVAPRGLRREYAAGR